MQDWGYRLKIMFFFTVKRAMLCSNAAENFLDIFFVIWLCERLAIKILIEI